jgi:glutaredoxin
VLIIYTRPNCPLCDRLKDLLARETVAFVERDITTDAEWYRRYRERIPVIVDGSRREHDPPFDAMRIAELSRLFG